MAFRLQRLHMFTTLVECGSPGRAANILKMTQPGRSLASKRLEAYLGSELLKRQTKSM